MRQEDFFWNPNHKRARDDAVFDGEGPMEARRTRPNHRKAGDTFDTFDTFDGLIDFDVADGQLYATGMTHSQSFGDLLDFTAFEQSSVEEAPICLRECVAGMDGKDGKNRNYGKYGKNRNYGKDGKDGKDGHVPQSSTGGSYVGGPNSEKGYGSDGSDASDQTEAVDEGRFKLFSLVGYRKSMAMAANSKHVASGVPFVMRVDISECCSIGARDVVGELLSCF